MIITNIIINEQYFKEIVLELGVPVLDNEDLEFSINDIKQLMILPAMRQFFMFFPLIQRNQYQISSTFSINFPDLISNLDGSIVDTFGVAYAGLNTAGYIGGVTPTSNPIVNAQSWSVSTNRYGRGAYGTRYDYDVQVSRVYEKMDRQGVIETNKAFKVDVNENLRTITGYSNIVGRLSVEWAQYTNVFDNIPYRWIPDVIKLSKANVLDAFANLRGQQISGLPNEFNAEAMKARAAELREDVENKFKKFTKVVLIR